MTAKCRACEGCGRVADTEEREPWTHWESLPVKNAAAVLLGVVRPIPCPTCKGSGEVGS